MSNTRTTPPAGPWAFLTTTRRTPTSGYQRIMAPAQDSWKDFFFQNMGFSTPSHTDNVPNPADVTNDVPGGILWEVQGVGGGPNWYSRRKVTLFTDGVLQLEDASGVVTLTPGPGTTLLPQDCLAVVCKATPLHYPISLPGTTTPIPKAAQRGWVITNAVFMNRGGRRTPAVLGNTPGMWMSDLVTAPQPRYVAQRLEFGTASVPTQWRSFTTAMDGVAPQVQSYQYGSGSIGIEDLDGITIQLAGGPNTYPTFRNSWGNWIGPLPTLQEWNSVQEFNNGDMDVTDLRPGLFLGNELGNPTLRTAVMCVDTAKWLARVYMFGGAYP